MLLFNKRVLTAVYGIERMVFAAVFFQLRDVEDIVDAFVQRSGGNSTLNALLSADAMTLKCTAYNCINF